MNRKMMRLARAGKWVFFTESGDPPGAIEDFPDAVCCSMALSASEPKPLAAVRRKFRRDGPNGGYKGFMIV